jgi:hypothetical protein
MTDVQKVKLDEAILKYKDRVDHYVKYNGKGAPLPLDWTGDEFVWVPRRNRRKLVK